MITLPSLRILLIEDNVPDAVLIREALNDIDNFEHEFVHAQSLSDGILQANKSTIDVCLLDLGLPDSQGIDTVRQFRRQAPDLPLLILTALDDVNIGLQALHEGALDYLVKRDVQPVMLDRSIRYMLERSNLLSELQDSRDRFRMLASRLQSIREQERMRISREIHDDLGQKLTALKIDLGMIDVGLAAYSDDPNLSKVREDVVDTISLADSVLDSVRRLAFELRPALLDHFGLSETIKEESRQFEARTGIEVNLTLAIGMESLNEGVSTTFFRIFQELMTNVSRHANASRIEVEFTQTDDSLVLAVSDDGVGIDADTRTSITSLGLLGIHERAHGHNGSVTIESMPGQGTRVTVAIPLQECVPLH